MRTKKDWREYKEHYVLDNASDLGKGKDLMLALVLEACRSSSAAHASAWWLPAD